MFSISLLKWFESARRPMPWRYAPDATPDPYAIWLSEMMLQQTTVTTVTAYFTRFIARWPTIHDLAKADISEVLHAWQGLGYYNRAHNLHACARLIVRDYGGVFPRTASELIELPGIGPYASAAIASIAFNERALVIDGNVERVLSRLFCLDFPPKKNRPLLEEKLNGIIGNRRYGEFAQAMMELGSEICKPKNPLCDKCPVSTCCKAFATNTISLHPVKLAKRARPYKYTTAYIITNDRGEILLRKRPNKGLLRGLIEVPTSPWELEKEQVQGTLPVSVKHVFTHFDLEVQIVKQQNNAPDQDGFFVPISELHTQALPSLMKKILDAALPSQDQLAA